MHPELLRDEHRAGTRPRRPVSERLAGIERIAPIRAVRHGAQS
jgi:hypothetical protein